MRTAPSPATGALEFDTRVRFQGKLLPTSVLVSLARNIFSTFPPVSARYCAEGMVAEGPRNLKEKKEKRYLNCTPSKSRPHGPILLL